MSAQAIGILKRAASIICGPSAYSRYASGAACVAVTKQWSASGAIERASRSLKSGAWMLGDPDPAMDEAKALVCRAVGYPHVDAWEHANRPEWEEVRSAFLSAAA